MELDFRSDVTDETTNVSRTAGGRTAAAALALLVIIVSAVFVLGSSSGAAEEGQRPGLSIALSIPYDSSFEFVNASGETRMMAFSCGWGHQPVSSVALGDSLLSTRDGAQYYSRCSVHVRLSSAYDISASPDDVVWCENSQCYAAVPAGRDVVVNLDEPIAARAGIRRDLSSPYLNF